MCQSELVHFPVRRRSPFSHILRASYCSQRLRDESNALFLSGCGTRLVSLLSVTWEFPRMVLCSAIFSHKTHKLVLSFEGGSKTNLFTNNFFSFLQPSLLPPSLLQFILPIISKEKSSRYVAASYPCALNAQRVKRYYNLNRSRLKAYSWLITELY